ncbi:MAG: hypothetical protein ACT4NU_00980 [Chromatiales bacterium]
MIAANTVPRLGIALLILRIGLGMFLMLWGLDKILEPDSTVRIFAHFYKLSITPSVASSSACLSCC